MILGHWVKLPSSLSVSRHLHTGGDAHCLVRTSQCLVRKGSRGLLLPLIGGKLKPQALCCFSLGSEENAALCAEGQVEDTGRREREPRGFGWSRKIP